MKIKITILLLFLHSFGFSQAIVEGKIEYNISLQIPDINKVSSNEKISKETRQKLITTYKNVSDVSSVLLFKKAEAIFKVDDKMDNDSNSSLNLTNLFSGGKSGSVYYYNSKTNENLTQKNAIGELYLVKEPLKKWELLQETKKIGLYNCYKAIELKNVNNVNSKQKPTIAWYAPQIPVNFGPGGYNGLPGLILELHVKNKLVYKAIKIELNPRKSIRIDKPSKGRIVTNMELRKILENAVPEFFERTKNE